MHGTTIGFSNIKDLEDRREPPWTVREFKGPGPMAPLLPLQAVIAWKHIAKELVPLEARGLLYTIAPDYRAENQSFIQTSHTVGHRMGNK